MKSIKLLSLLLILALLFTVTLVGCNKKADTETNDEQSENQQTDENEKETSDETSDQQVQEEDYYLGKYEPNLVLNVPFTDDNRTAPKGDDPKDNNIWTRAYKEKLGIEFNYVWEVKGKDYNTKLNMAIATDELPDVFHCSFNTYSRLASAGKLADLTDLYEKYLLPELYDTVTNKDEKYMDSYSVNGKIYGLSQHAAPKTSFLHYRNDWAEKVGITEKPETLEDVIDMAYAFAEGDPNGDGSKVFGLGVNNIMWKAPGQIDLFFNAVDAYPDIWVEKDGKLVYGGILEENKEALKILQQMCKDGVIDNEFGLKSPWSELSEDVSADKLGMLIAPQYFTDWGAVRTVSQNHPWEATWTSVIMPHKDGGYAKGKTTARAGKEVWVARKDFEHPEVIMKMNNLTYKLLFDKETAKLEYHTVMEGENKIAVFFLNFFNVAKIDADLNANLVLAQEVTDCLDGKITEDELSSQAKKYYDDSKAYVDETDFNGYNYYHCYSMYDGTVKPLEKKIADEKIYKIDGFYGANTDTMNKNLGNITQKRNELFTKIIMGADIDETFQEWVDYFNTQGGEEITQEVNNWRDSRE